MKRSLRTLAGVLAGALLVGGAVAGFAPAPALAAAGAFQSVNSSAALAASARSINVPASTAAGNTLITELVVSQSTMTGTSAPAGWTLACSQVGVGVTVGVWWRTATGSEPGSYSLTVPAGSGVVGNMHRYTGLNATNPVDACAGQASSTAGTTATVPAVTVHGGDALLFSAIGWQHAGTATPPTGYTERADAKTSKDPVSFLAVSSETADKDNGACLTGSCAVSSTTATIAQLSGEPTPQWAGIHVALIPSAPPAPTNTAVPTVSGRTQVGQTLTATTGTWVGWPTITYAYQWQDCTGSCTNISGATSSTYTLVAGDLVHRLKVQVTATSTGGASASALSGPTRYIGNIFDDFSGSNGIIENEYSFYNPPGSGSPGTHFSADWDMNSGCLFRDGNAGRSSNPDTISWPSAPTDSCSPKTNNNDFRMLSSQTFSGDTTIVVEKLRQNVDIHGAAQDYYGTHIWPRYSSEQNLYYVSVNRADGDVIIKRKVPCGPDNGGTYINLTAETSGHDWTVSTDKQYKVTITVVSGAVVIKLYDLAVSSSTPILTGTDPATGSTNPNWQQYCDNSPVGVHDGILDTGPDIPADAYPSSSYSPITGSGKVGFRGDFADFTVDTVSVVPGLI